MIDLELLAKLSLESFGVDLDQLRKALLASPNARGYIIGAVSEYLLREQLETSGFKVRRIREKWQGKKLHFGDLYVSRDEKRWYVLESKGLKSNAEKWYKVAQIDASLNALKNPSHRKREGELAAWWRRIPDERRQRILKVQSFNQAKVLATHFVSAKGTAGRQINTNRKDEFHVVSLDLYLRLGVHRFIFAPSRNLESAEGYPNHLKQNYLIDVLVPGVDSEPILPKPWTDDFESVFSRLKNPVAVKDMQVDDREPGERGGETGLDE